MRRKTCVQCGAMITHHHKYCEKHYPKKTATILSLRNKIKAFERTIRFLLSPGSNPNKYITKKQLISTLKKNGIKDDYTK